jgi:hypothetical protein
LPQRLRRPPLLDLNQLLPAGYVPSCNKLASKGRGHPSRLLGGAMMRMTPAQGAVRLICGESLPPFAVSPDSFKDRLLRGRELLVQLTGKDFGFDLQAWHDHLKFSRDGGYTWGRNIVLPKIMKAALESREWREAVGTLSRGTLRES